MYSNVLVGIEEGDRGRDAVALARTLSPRARRLTFAHVDNHVRLGQRGHARTHSAPELHVSLELLARLRDELAPDAQVASVVDASVGDGLRGMAERFGADLIVVGSSRRSRIGRVASGNDTLSVLHHAPCAVAVAPRGYTETAAGVQTIGVAYDGSAQSKVALVQARRLARGLGAQLKGLDVKQITVYGHHWDAPYVENEAIEIANERQRVGHLKGLDLSVVVGQTAVELERFSEEVDVLVCGSRELGPVGRVMLGSTTDSLVRHVRSAVLVVPALAERTRAAEHSMSLSRQPLSA
jgi:nucleotide-binding universal stress UspA family protein